MESANATLDLSTQINVFHNAQLNSVLLVDNVLLVQTNVLLVKELLQHALAV